MNEQRNSRVIQLTLNEDLVRALQAMVRYSFREIQYSWDGLTDLERTFIWDQKLLDDMVAFARSQPEELEYTSDMAVLLARCTEAMQRGEHVTPGTDRAREQRLARDMLGQKSS